MKTPQEIQWFSRAGRLLDIEEDGVTSFDVQGGRALYLEVRFCTRCGGQGRSNQWSHTGYTCFKCGGTGGKHTVMRPCYTQSRLAQIMDLAERKEQARKEKMERERQAAYERRRIEYADWIADPELNHAALAWVREYREDKSDFMQDMARRLADCWIPTERQYEAMVNSYNRHLELQRRISESRYLAPVGEKLEPVKVKLTKLLDWSKHDAYPPIYKYLHEMTTEDNQIILYTGNSKQMNYRVGDEFIVTGKVKEHKEFRGQKQTCIERPTTQELLNAHTHESGELFQTEQG